MATYKKPPGLEGKLYAHYIEELKGWAFVTDLEKVKQGLAVALPFPEDDESQIRDRW